jgi:hypothetical protein
MLIVEILLAWFVVSVPAALLCGAALYRNNSEFLTDSVPSQRPPLRTGARSVQPVG